MRFGVIPKNAYGIISAKEYFSRAVRIAPRTAIEVKSITVTDFGGNEVHNLNGLSRLKFHIKLRADSECIIYIAAYSSGGELEDIKTIPLDAGEYDMESDLSGNVFGSGSYVRILIFETDDLTKPIYSKKI